MQTAGSRGSPVLILPLHNRCFQGQLTAHVFRDERGIDLGRHKSLSVKFAQRIHRKRRVDLRAMLSREFVAFYEFAASSSSKCLQRFG